MSHASFSAMLCYRWHFLHKCCFLSCTIHLCPPYPCALQNSPASTPHSESACIPCKHPSEHVCMHHGFRSQVLAKLRRCGHTSRGSQLSRAGGLAMAQLCQGTPSTCMEAMTGASARLGAKTMTQVGRYGIPLIGHTNMSMHVRVCM